MKRLEAITRFNVSPLQLLRRLAYTISNVLERNEKLIVTTYAIEIYSEPRLVEYKLQCVVIDDTVGIEYEDLFGDDYYLEEEQ